jgi:hypothetical protein
VADALPHHAAVLRAGVDDGRGDGGDALVSDDRIVLHAEQQRGNLEVLRLLRWRTAWPVQALHQVQRADGAELRVELAPLDDELAHPVGGRAVQRVTAGVDELAVGLAERLGLGDQVVELVGVTAASRGQCAGEGIGGAGAVALRVAQRGGDGVGQGGH